MKLVIAEKPSVAVTILAFTRKHILLVEYKLQPYI